MTHITKLPSISVVQDQNHREGTKEEIFREKGIKHHLLLLINVLRRVAEHKAVNSN